jgi:hypothetical protein
MLRAASSIAGFAPLLAAEPGDDGELDIWLIGGASLGAIVVLGLAAWLWKWWGDRERQPYTSPNRLFTQLCRVHALDRTSRRALLAVARHQHLGNPSRLFVEPDRWHDGPLGHVLTQYPKHIERLRRRLFGAAFPFHGAASAP